MLARNRFGTEALASLFRFFVQGSCMAVTVPWMVRELGAVGYGLWIFAWSFFGLVGVFDLGFGTAAVKVVAEARGGERVEERNRRLSTISAILIAWSVVSLPGIFWLAEVAVRLADLPATEESAAFTVMLLLGIRLITLGMPLSLFRGILYGGSEIVRLSLVQAAASVLLAATTLTVLFLGAELQAVAMAHLSVMLLEHLVMAMIAFRRIPSLRLSWRLVDLKTVPEMTSLSFAFFLSGLAGAVLLRTDPLIVQLGASLLAVAAYGLAQKLIEMATAVVKQVTNLMAPRAARLELQRPEDLRPTLVAGLRLGLGGAGLVALPLALLAEPLLRLWLGEVPGDAESLLGILALSLFVSGPQLGAAGVLAMSGSHHVMGRLALLSAVSNVGLSLLFVGVYGVHGVAVATLIVTLVFDAGIVPILAARRVGTTVLALWAEVLAPLCLPGIVWLSSLVALRVSAWSESELHLVIGGCLCLVALGSTLPLAQLRLSMTSRFSG
ncbi:MAG: hypothetical protein MI919_02860 [Holophagales bacterium]|nr:hypothetical protein [Holophagales bacterium]